MATEDLKTLAEIGTAIWGDPDFSQRATVETVAAVSLLDLNPERTVERAAAALLERANNEGTAAMTRRNLNRMNEPFYHLPVEERFLLVALHIGRWSYARLARVMDETPERIEEMAWVARTRILTLMPTVKRGATPVWPVGQSFKGPYCPEYEPSRPWTQRFMDEEIASGADRLFLQNHLMVCDACRNVLNRCREVYFTVDAMVPREAGAAAQAQGLRDAARTSRKIQRSLWAPDFLPSLKIFFKRPDILLFAALFLGLLVLKLKA